MKKTMIFCAVILLCFCVSFAGCNGNCSHTWGEWETVSAPTCTEKGEVKRICSKNASHTETRPIPALGHDLEWVVSLLDNQETGTCKRADCDYFRTSLSPNPVFFNPDVESAEAQNGAYFLTRAGYEAYIRSRGGNEEWIQSQINDDERFEKDRKDLAVIIYNNLLSYRSSQIYLSYRYVRVYQTSRSENYYAGQPMGQPMGQRFDTPLLFSLSGDTLNIRTELHALNIGFSDKRIDLQFELDPSVLFSAEEPDLKISAPEKFDTNSYGLTWASKNFYGILGVKLELQIAGTQSFIPIQTSPSYYWGFNPNPNEYRFSLFWEDLKYLQKGANQIRVALIGGPVLKDGKIYLTTDSETVTHDIVVNKLNVSTLAAPTDFKIIQNGHWLEWASDENMLDNAIYVKRPGGDFEKTTWDFGDGDAIPLPTYTSVASLKLGVGENTIRVVSSNDSPRLEGGVFTAAYDSPPGEFKITVNSTAEQQVAAPANIEILYNELIPGGYKKVYLNLGGNYIRLDSYWWHGAEFVDWSDLEIGENKIRIIAEGVRGRLTDGVLTTYTDSDPVDIIVIKDAHGNIGIK